MMMTMMMMMMMMMMVMMASGAVYAALLRFYRRLQINLLTYLRQVVTLGPLRHA